MTKATPELLIATGNKHKSQEIESLLRGLLPGLHFRIRLASEFTDLEEPEETGVTFIENALIKARYYARATGLLALADDSGLVVDALDGRPGVYSARYADTAQGRIERVLGELEGVEDDKRTARFVCVAALADPVGPAVVREGRVEGHIIHEARGNGGFGYDPIFVPKDSAEGDPQNVSGRTLAQYGEDEKNSISHRGRAIRALAPMIEQAVLNGRIVEPA